MKNEALGQIMTLALSVKLGFQLPASESGNLQKWGFHGIYWLKVNLHPNISYMALSVQLKLLEEGELGENNSTTKKKAFTSKFIYDVSSWE